MPVGSAFAAFVADQFAGLDGVTIKKMFGGLGVFRDGVMFAVAVNDVLYLRIDAATQTLFEAEGQTQLAFPGRDAHGMVPMPYFSVPERLFEDESEFLDWARTASAAATMAKAGPRKKRKA